MDLVLSKKLPRLVLAIDAEARLNLIKMSSQNFVDYVKICCRSGKGGAGSVHMLEIDYTKVGLMGRW